MRDAKLEPHARVCTHLQVCSGDVSLSPLVMYPHSMFPHTLRITNTAVRADSILVKWPLDKGDPVSTELLLQRE